MKTSLDRLEEIDAPARVRDLLHLSRAEPVLLIELTRRARGEPANHSINYVPARIGRRVPANALGNSPLTDLLRNRCGMGISTASQTLRAAAAPEGVAERLELPVSAPVLHSEFVVYAGSRPVLVSLVYYHTDQSFFTATLVSISTGLRGTANGQEQPGQQPKAAAPARRRSSRPARESQRLHSRGRIRVEVRRRFIRSGSEGPTDRPVVRPPMTIKQ